MLQLHHVHVHRSGCFHLAGKIRVLGPLMQLRQRRRGQCAAEEEAPNLDELDAPQVENMVYHRRMRFRRTHARMLLMQLLKSLDGMSRLTQDVSCKSSYHSVAADRYSTDTCSPVEYQ